MTTLCKLFDAGAIDWVCARSEERIDIFQGGGEELTGFDGFFQSDFE